MIKVDKVDPAILLKQEEWIEELDINLYCERIEMEEQLDNMLNKQLIQKEKMQIQKEEIQTQQEEIQKKIKQILIKYLIISDNIECQLSELMEKHTLLDLEFEQLMKYHKMKEQHMFTQLNYQIEHHEELEKKLNYLVSQRAKMNYRIYHLNRQMREEHLMIHGEHWTEKQIYED